MTFEEAAEFGKKAYHNDLMCAPAQDVEFNNAVRPYMNHFPTFMGALEGWHRGWAVANLADN